MRLADVRAGAAAVMLRPPPTCLPDDMPVERHARYLQKIRSTVRPLSSFSPSVKRRTVPNTTL